MDRGNEEVELHYQIQFSVILGSLPFVEWILFLCRGYNRRILSPSDSAFQHFRRAVRLRFPSHTRQLPSST